MFFYWLLQDGRTAVCCPGGGRVGQNPSAQGAPTLPSYCRRVSSPLTLHFQRASNLREWRLESLRKISSGQRWCTSVGTVLELSRKTTRMKSGLRCPVRVRWDFLVRTPSNPHRVSRPHNGAERRVCSGHKQLASFFFWTLFWSSVEAGGFLCLEWTTPAGGVILPRGLRLLWFYLNYPL